MALTAVTFRQVFPEFGDTQRWTDPIVEFWLTNASALVNEDRWGPLYDTGVALYAAHNLVLSVADNMAASAGGTPGISMPGVISSKSADGLAVSYDTSTAAEDGAGNFSLTSYGTRYWQLLRLHGAGPVQIGTGITDAGTSLQSAWQGPYTWPF